MQQDILMLYHSSSISTKEVAEGLVYMYSSSLGVPEEILNDLHVGTKFVSRGRYLDYRV